MRNDNIELIPVGQQPTKPPKWEMSLNGAMQQGPASYPVLNAPKGETADFSFTIRHPGGIAFAKDNPFCAQLGTAKPTACDVQAFSAHIDANSGALVVHDSNPTEATYTYVINFDRAPQLDPVIKNGGCCTGVSSSAYSFTTIVEYSALALLVIAAVIVAVRMFRPGPVDESTPS
jgi:hypothetical protein